MPMTVSPNTQLSLSVGAVVAVVLQIVAVTFYFGQLDTRVDYIERESTGSTQIFARLQALEANQDNMKADLAIIKTRLFAKRSTSNP